MILSAVKTEFLFYFRQQLISSFSMRENLLSTNSQMLIIAQFWKATICILIIVLLFLIFIPFLGGKHNTRQVKAQIRKSTLIILFTKEKMPTLAGNKHSSIHFFPHGPRPFHLRQKRYRSDPSEMNLKVVIPAPTP